MLKITELSETNVVLIRHGFHDSLAQLVNITSPKLRSFNLGSSNHVLNMWHCHPPELIIDTRHNLGSLS